MNPGDPSESEFIRRLKSHDPEERMPYEKDPLDKKEIEILTNWIKQGAKWDTHWAYLPVKKIDTSGDLNGDANYEEWAKNEIDYFIYEKLMGMGLSPSKDAPSSTLGRRISIDLIGLPVTEDTYDQQWNNSTETDLKNYIDVLLKSPHFGEKWAGMWMDLARYSDTKGYERDDARTIWKYRDWLIHA